MKPFLKKQYKKLAKLREIISFTTVKKIVQNIKELLNPIRITLVDIYLIKEFIKTALGAMVLFITIYLFSLLVNDVPFFLNQMSTGNKLITMDKILTMYLNQIPHKALWVSPLAFLFSTIYTMGTFYKNNEAVAYIGAGVHIFRLTFVVLIVSFTYSILLIPFTNYVVVPTFDKAEMLSLEMRRKSEKDPTIDLETFGANNTYYFIKKFDPVKKIMQFPIIARERNLKSNKIAQPNYNAYFDVDDNLNFPTELTEKSSEPAKQLISQRNKKKMPLPNLTSIPQTEAIKQLSKNFSQKQLKKMSVRPHKKMTQLIKKPAKPKPGIGNNVTVNELTDDFPYHNVEKKPIPTIIDQDKKATSFDFSQLELPIGLTLSDPAFVYRREQSFLDAERKFILQNKNNPIERKDLIGLVDQAFDNMQNKSKWLTVTTENQNKPVAKAETHLYQHDSNQFKNQATRDDVKNNKINPSVEDLRFLSRLSSNRGLPLLVKRIPELLANKVNTVLAQPKIQSKQEKLSQTTTNHTPASQQQAYLSDWKPLESMEEMSLLDMPAYYRFTSLDNLIQEQALEGSDPTPLQFSIPLTKYHIMPYPAYFEFRIDAREARWNDKLKKWILYDAEKRYWNVDKGLYKIRKLADGYVLNEVTDHPRHILIKKKPMDRLTFGEGTELITSLQRARKKWRGFAIDLYANKIAFQLSTFLIVLVGLSLGQFHSRKLVFVNSLFMAILIFLLYFVLFQLGVSLAKITDIFPIILAPWLGNIAFFIFGIYMMRRAKT